MQEKTVSTMDELLAVKKDYENKEYYFRGENKDYGQTACVPSYFRPGCRAKFNYEWSQKMLADLGVGVPHFLSIGDSTTANIVNTLVNLEPWKEEQLEALMQHYIPDFQALTCFLRCLLKKSALEQQYVASFCTSYLDITSDIFFALHLVCSQYYFLPGNEGKTTNQQEAMKDGCLYIFDLKEVENTTYLKLVDYPSYSYLCKRGDQLYYQPFDRITHQRGAFLAPKRNKEGTIESDKLIEEMKNQIHTKLIITSSVKKELYEVFGGKNGLDYYFPKIPSTFEANIDIQQVYRNLQGTTVFV